MSGNDRSAARQPLSASWREWLQSPDWQGRERAGPPFDAIVVGSGYGGSVAALRLAQKNYRVLLLERGSEYLPGEFPNDFSLLPKFFRSNVPTSGAPMGRATGLVEVHLGQGMVAVTGNGLGGGSLINAGVVMQPDADVFAQPHWPAAIRHAHAPGLQPFYDRARAQLRVTRWDSSLPGKEQLGKTLALGRLGAAAGAQAEAVDLTVDPQRCLRCGDCASGCNVPDAKGSLPETYLKAALATGRVQIVTQAEVYRFEAEVSAGGAHQGWRVHAFATDAQQEFLATREMFSDTRASATTRQLLAPMLFVCAGTMGSTQLLQRSQSLAGDKLFFSPALGTRVSGNGDSLSWVVGEDEAVGSLGRGAAGVVEWEKARAGAAYQAGSIVGPTITAAIRRRDSEEEGTPRRLPLERRLVLQDGAVPRAIAQLYRELLATASTLKALDGWWLRELPRASELREDPLAASDHRAQHTQVLLAMGHDGSPARLVWLEGSDRTAPYLPAPEQLATYQEQQKLFDRIGARHVHSPLWQAMPKAATELMAGPRPSPTITTVHPLGGCVMSDDPDCGVVDDLGRVWVHDPGRRFIAADAMQLPVKGQRDVGHRNEPRLYQGLYVLDGAIVPTALGCNPLWTIAALAERALDALPEKTGATAAATAGAAVLRGEVRTPQALPSVDVRIDAKLHEVLIASHLRLHGALARRFAGQPVAARVQATFSSKDIQSDMRQRRHALDVQARLVLGHDGPQQPVQVAYEAATGLFEPMPAARGSSGPGLFLRTMLELLLLALAVVAVPAAAFRGWGAFAAALGLLAALLLLLPFSRTLVTWLVLRVRRDFPDQAFRAASLSQRVAWGMALLRQLVHASEKRVMVYRVPMRREGDDAAVPEEVTLHATKTVMYRASIVQLLLWLLRTVQGRPQALRPTFWEQSMNARLRVVRGRLPRWAPALLKGTFCMGFDNLTSSGLSAARRHAQGAMELGLRGDTTSGMLALASYPMLFLRFALKTRLLDFRLPTYSQLPLPDQASEAETRLRLPGGGFALAELHTIAVRRGFSSSDRGDESQAPLQLQLRRYRARDAQGQVQPTEIRRGTWQGLPVARAKSVLLLHAFGQSGLTFTLKTVPENLAERFLREGHEVWVLEMRMSTRSGYAADACSVDQIAENDIPGAVKHILKQLQAEQPQPESHALQIGAFAQCIGAAALWMSILSGRLSHGIAAAQPIRGTAPSLSMLSHAMTSQVHPWLVGARGTQSKTWLPTLLQAIWRRGSIPFAVRGPQEGMFLPMLDRLLATLPAPAAEDCKVDGHEDASATCRRIRFIEAPLFRHENINRDTFAAMNLLFGEANLRLFTHARRFVDRERLVDEDGINRYVTDDNLRRHAAFPIQLLHGAANELFDASSATRAFSGLANFHEGWQRNFCVRRDGQVGPVLVEGHGHLDVLIGAAASSLVFPEILHFFGQALAARDHVAGQTEPRGWVARPPRIGPFVGWLREQGAATLLRVSFIVDDRGGLSEGAKLPDVLLRYQPPGRSQFVTWTSPVRWNVLTTGTARAGDRAVAERVAWADLDLGADGAEAQAWQVLTLHESWHAQVGLELLGSPRAADPEIDRFINQVDADMAPELVLPRLSDGHAFPFQSAVFRVPPVALATLPRESALVPFAVACCRHPGLGLDQARVDTEVQRFVDALPRDPAAFAMLLGDQIYADATAGLVDPASPLERYYERHETAFRREGLGQLLAALPVYLTPDDHEWTDGYPLGGPLVEEHWPDWTPGSSYAQRERLGFRVAAQAITAFQRVQSPLGPWPKPSYRFRHGCARFFVIDTRYDRQRNRPEIVAPDVFARLARWLAQPEAQDSLNVIASGSVVLPGVRMNADPANPGCIDTWQYAQAQRRELLELLLAMVPGRFLLLSGDYHVSGAALLRQGGRTVGAAVLAPPLYAPMPYANATPEAVFVDEEIALAGGTLKLELPAGGDIARGSGLGRLEVRRSAGGFSVGYRRELWVWETGERTELEASIAL
ncbi:MAG: Choline dehydrogenase and related flavoprotein [Ramlibacter sp.]|nr:Choline dehydrogenase and related flavoprotein [Ramlibacter sp.]